VGQFKGLLLGYGLQGRGALYDLSKSELFSEITVVDQNPELESLVASIGDSRIRPLCLDLSDKNLLQNLIKQHSVVISLLPRDFGLPVARMAIECGTNFVSASYLFDPAESDPVQLAANKEEFKKLDQEAKRKGIVVLTEFGLDPGLDILLGGQIVRHFDKITRFFSYGAGFPELEAANNVLRYKFTWTVDGVMRSYLRPARVIANGTIKEIPADEIFKNENIHEMKVKELGGILECFPNGDSVSYAERLGIKNTVKDMGRYVCRWQGHSAFWYVMAQCGFLHDEPVLVNGVPVVPRSFVATLLSSQDQFWYGEKERDVTLTRVEAEGEKDGKTLKMIYQIIDKRDIATGFTSMQRTVGFVVAMGAQMILDRTIDNKGILTPLDVPFTACINELAKRNINLTTITC